ncbi:MAG: hypothetical protein A2138_22140 [Deltaproteobacteria bacterium RBG_16_71_12]|nr:MAG: hypothetical protein A2138_22140 [Deltaproteobacteria bacterium RBG_16_71_12]
MIGRAGLLTLAASACVAPVYDDRLGVAGVATDEGALEGTFGLASTAADLAEVPLLGEQVGGGMTFALVERSWDGEGYRQTNTICRVINYEVAGLASAVSEETVHAIPRIPVPIAVDHAAGTFATDRFFELWAVQGLSPDEDMPTAPDDARFYDMDGDDKPGATMTTSGLVTGEVYFAQRKGLAFEGVVRGPDEAFGLLTHRKEATVIDATDDLLKTQTVRAQHPDPKLSWWHEVRVADSAGCAELTAAVDDGSFSLLRPF